MNYNEADITDRQRFISRDKNKKIMNTYILQNGDREDLRTIKAKNWDEVEDLIKEENEKLRAEYNQKVITYQELAAQVIQYAKGKKSTLYI